MSDITPRVSVIVATYNRGNGLRENIDSVLDQDFDAYEAIYVDDGSTDETPTILREYEDRYPGRFRSLRVDNGGQGQARNAGAREARGEFLLITDDDVVAPRNWVSGMLGIYEKRPCDAATGGFEPYSMETPVERYLHYRTRALFGPRPRYVSVAPMMSFLIPRELFREAGGFIAEPIEDWVFCQEFVRSGRRIYYDPSVSIVHHYQRNWTPAAQRIRTPAIRGVYDRADRGHPLAPYIAYSTARFLLSPLWSLWRYPLDLYGMSLRMEAIFWVARMRAYASTFTGRRLHTPH